MVKKRRRRQGVSELRTLQRKLRSDDFFAGKEIVVKDTGKEKMSEVLRVFVEPYREMAPTYEDYKTLLAIATIAWNTALIPKEKRKQVLEDTIKAGSIPNDTTAFHLFLEALDELIVRKECCFAGNKRFIVSYQLSERRNDYHLSVVSTL